MREWIEVRVFHNEVIRRLPPDLGVNMDSADKIASVRKYTPDYEGLRRIFLARDNPRWSEFVSVVADAEAKGATPNPWNGFTAWFVRRYTERELAEAELFRLVIAKIFEPEGESCGTVYDESTACPLCGAGRTQVNDLHLQLRAAYQGWPSIPKAKHTGVARTIADEVIVSYIVADLMKEHGISGAELRPVRGSGERAKVTPLWKQLCVIGNAGRTVPPTEIGLGPFRHTDVDTDGKNYRCPRGHVSGLSLLSEVYLKRKAWDGRDIAATEDMFGLRAGVLVPAPLLLISQRFYQLLKENNVKGFKVEVAHLV
jgi:hypothetical protein